jgi:1-aminocyclopropane-1-carboxylate deaminase/D-cysteine desulfhydrase-like pyridoxal-dependent ACC family enzyme
MQGLALGGAGFGASSYLRSRHSLPPLPPSGQLGGMIPPTSVLSEQKLALASFMPELTDPGARNVPLIVNSLIKGAGGRRRIGAPGNAVFAAEPSGRAVIPWTPLFAREKNLIAPPAALRAKLGGADLLVLNESSNSVAVFGNKARKYEFILPNLHWAGVRRLATLGAVSSNHALQFALANRLADVSGDGQTLNSELDLVLFEVPGAATDEKRLAMLQSLAQRVVVAENTLGLAGEAAYEWASHRIDPDREAIVAPGGSNELSALGHMNAMAELALLLKETQAWPGPPDVIFVAMGSGSTVLGLMLGVHLLGWPTKVIGVADQDKPFLARLVANQQPALPFVEGNVRKLARNTLDWLRLVQFPSITETTLDRIQREIFTPDSQSWAPGYGLVRDDDIAWRSELKELGIGLDPVFTLKAWRSLVSLAQTGAFRDKRVLFWNTYNSFDYNAHMGPLLSGRPQLHA